MHYVVVGFMVLLYEEEGVVVRAELQFGNCLLVKARECGLGREGCGEQAIVE